MLICAYDTETTGFRDPIYLVEIAAVLVEVSPPAPSIERASFSFIIQPDGWHVPSEVARIHGITQEIAERYGVPAIIALAALTNLWAVADARVAHNAEYDDRVLVAAIARLGRESTRRRPPVYCTKDLAMPVVNLPPTERMIAAGFGGKPKAPKLEECYKFFFGEELVGAHGALADARASARVFDELMRRGGVPMII